MDFVSAYYWQQGENISALLLQQCRLRDKTAFFACVWEGRGKRAGMAGRCLAERFLAWFRGFRLSRAVKSPERFLERHAGELEALVREADEDFMKAGAARLAGEGVSGTVALASFAGIFCLEEHFILFGRGSAGIRLLNHGIGKTCVGNPIGYGEELRIRQGVLEPGIGLLLATDSFYRNVEEDAMREGLSVEEVLNGIQTEKHLRELGRAAEKAGGGNMAAVLLYAREE